MQWGGLYSQLTLLLNLQELFFIVKQRYKKNIGNKGNSPGPSFSDLETRIIFVILWMSIYAI